MTELQLYKFVQGKEFNVNENETILFIDFLDLKEFTEMLSPCAFDDSGREMVLMQDCVAVPMKGICEYEQVRMEKVFIEKPTSEQFGYESPSLYSEGGWMFEGGEEKYHKELKKYHKLNSLKNETPQQIKKK
jgi:hypothetical protein